MGKRVSISLGILQLFIGVGALAGGWAFIIDPTGGILGIPFEYIENTPFHTYLIPGIILFTFNGIGSCIAGFLTLRRYRYAGEIAVVFGAGLVIWITVQLQFISYSWMHTLYLLLGLAELALGLMLRKAMKK
jgi:hypothetical protein